MLVVGFLVSLFAWLIGIFPASLVVLLVVTVIGVVHRVRHLLNAVWTMNRVMAVNDAGIVFLFLFVLDGVRIVILDMVGVLVGLGFVVLDFVAVRRSAAFIDVAIFDIIVGNTSAVRLLFVGVVTAGGGRGILDASVALLGCYFVVDFGFFDSATDHQTH